MTRRFFSALAALLLCFAAIGEANAEETLCDGLLKVYRSGKTGFYELIERRRADHEIDPEMELPGTFEPNYFLPSAKYCGIMPSGDAYTCVLAGETEPDAAQVLISQQFAQIRSCFLENVSGSWEWRFFSKANGIVRKEPQSWNTGRLYNPHEKAPSILIFYHEKIKNFSIGVVCDKRCRGPFK